MLLLVVLCRKLSTAIQVVNTSCSSTHTLTWGCFERQRMKTAGSGRTNQILSVSNYITRTPILPLCTFASDLDKLVAALVTIGDGESCCSYQPVTFHGYKSDGELAKVHSQIFETPQGNFNNLDDNGKKYFTRVRKEVQSLLIK